MEQIVLGKSKRAEGVEVLIMKFFSANHATFKQLSELVICCLSFHHTVDLSPYLLDASIFIFTVSKSKNLCLSQPTKPHERKCQTVFVVSFLSYADSLVNGLNVLISWSHTKCAMNMNLHLEPVRSGQSDSGWKPS